MPDFHVNFSGTEKFSHSAVDLLFLPVAFRDIDRKLLVREYWLQPCETLTAVDHRNACPVLADQRPGVSYKLVRHIAFVLRYSCGRESPFGIRNYVKRDFVVLY